MIKIKKKKKQNKYKQQLISNVMLDLNYILGI